MCGIAGICSGDPNPTNERRCAAMTALLAHRGPDSDGTWVSLCRRVALGHRRLSVIDLSESNNQPMVSDSGRYAIVFNGEIYNFRALRRQLRPYPYRTSGDTETILAAVEQWGLDGAVSRLRGMFAFALWDAQRKSLSLVRDRIGIKPLYYCKSGNEIAFCSELRGIERIYGSRLGTSRQALSLYLRLLYIPAPHTIYNAVSKLEPGTMVEFRCRGSSILKTERVYWSYHEAFISGLEDVKAIPSRDHGEELLAELKQATRLHLESDVPVGLLLSGGIDSALVGFLVQQASDRPIKAFSIGFKEAGYDESGYAREMARALKMEHHVLRADATMATNVVPRLARIYDEPFADPSSVVTYLVFQLANPHVTVCLSGDGGDEAFFGYNRYFQALALARQFKRIPQPAAAVLAHIADALNRLLPSRKWETLAHHLRAATPAQSYLGFVSKTLRPSRFADVDDVSVAQFDVGNLDLSRANAGLIYPYIDSTSYLPEDILTKVDRASMAVSLEARVPLLDHRVVERSLAVPFELKYRSGRGKLILRELLRNGVPARLLNRPKQGFTPPLQVWLRTELRGWAEDLLSPSKLNSGLPLKIKPIRKLWRDYLDKGKWDYSLWSILNYIQWVHTDRTV